MTQSEVRDSQNRILRTDTVGRVHIRGGGVSGSYPGGRAAERFDGRYQRPAQWQRCREQAAVA